LLQFEQLLISLDYQHPHLMFKEANLLKSTNSQDYDWPVRFWSVFRKGQNPMRRPFNCLWGCVVFFPWTLIECNRASNELSKIAEYNGEVITPALKLPKTLNDETVIYPTSTLFFSNQIH
jgi:hypothetical protein